MNSTLEDLTERGAAESELCFILHRFIPASAAAWVYADPSSQIVRVDSLWGVPDGLQFLPHDTFHYDIKRERISAETLRFKTYFIQESDDGSWKQIPIARRYGRARSLAAADVADIASHSFELAKAEGRPVQVMWFCGIPPQHMSEQICHGFLCRCPNLKSHRIEGLLNDA